MASNNNLPEGYVFQEYPKMIYESGKPGIGPGTVVKDKEEESQVKEEWRKGILKDSTTTKKEVKTKKN